MTSNPELPVVSERIQGYSFAWASHGITIEASKVQVHKSDNRVTGELTVLLGNDEGKLAVIYPPTSFNFTAGRTRVELSNILSRKKDCSQYPWAFILDQLCFGVQDRARRGEPVQELWTHDEVPELEYLIDPVLIKGVPTIIFGEKGVGKSTLALVFYLCLILPWHDNPLGLVAPKRPVKTLILDYELPGYIAQRNMKRLVEGMDIASIPLYHRRCSAPLADELEQVSNHIANMKAEVIIIDSLARACGGDLIKTEPANAFFEALDKLNTTSLIIAQTSKDIESKRKTIYGNALFTYYARSIFELCQADTLQENSVDIALFHRWSNLDKRHKDMGFRINYNGHHTNIESQPVSLEEFSERVSSQRKLLELLKQGAMKPKAIAEALGSSEGATRVLLSKLKKRGQLIQVKEGWGLKAKTPENEA